MYIFVYLFIFYLLPNVNAVLARELLSVFACHVSRGLKCQKMYCLFFVVFFRVGFVQGEGMDGLDSLEKCVDC